MDHQQILGFLREMNLNDKICVQGEFFEFEGNLIAATMPSNNGYELTMRVLDVESEIKIYLHCSPLIPSTIKGENQLKALIDLIAS